MGLKSIAIPLLGTGTGKLSEKKVMELYHQAFSQVNDLEIVVYIHKKGKHHHEICKQ